MSQKKPMKISNIIISNLEELTDEQLELIAGGGIIMPDTKPTTYPSVDTGGGGGHFS